MDITQPDHPAATGVVGDHNQYCTFFLGDGFFGIAVEYVQEIIRYQQITRVALAPPLIRGLINLRGQIVTAIELREILGMPPRESEQSPMNIIVSTSAGNFSLLVDRIGDVLDLPAAQSELPPNNLEGASTALISHTYKLEGELMLALDVERISANEFLGKMAKAS